MKRFPTVFWFQVTRFVIVFVERAGSTYLMTALQSDLGIRVLTEKLGVLRSEGKGAAEQLEWARVFLSPSVLGRHYAIGFKTKLVDVLDPGAFRQLLIERQCRVIQLNRRNTVKGAVSTLNARRRHSLSGSWNRLVGSSSLPPFEVNLEEFDGLLREREALDVALEEYVDTLPLPTLKLKYEDLLENQGYFVGSVMKFLGSSAEPRCGATLKNTGDDLRRAILNFDELRSRYAGTKYESMFDEVLVPA